MLSFRMPCISRAPMLNSLFCFITSLNASSKSYCSSSLLLKLFVMPISFIASLKIEYMLVLPISDLYIYSLESERLTLKF